MRDTSLPSSTVRLPGGIVSMEKTGQMLDSLPLPLKPSEGIKILKN